MNVVIFRVIGTWMGGFAGLIIYVLAFTDETEIGGPILVMLMIGGTFGAIPGVFVGGVIGAIKEFISQARGGQTTRPDVPKILRLGVAGSLVGGLAGVGFVVLLLMGDEARPAAVLGAGIGYLIVEYVSWWLNRRSRTNPLD